MHLNLGRVFETRGSLIGPTPDFPPQTSKNLSFLGLAKLVHDIQHAVLASIMCPVLDKVIGPDMVCSLRPKPEARPVVETKAPLLRLLTRHFQPLTSPDPRHPLDVHRPASRPQHGCDPPIAVAAVLSCECDDVRRQCGLIIRHLRDVALRRAMLTENAAGKALRDTMFGNHMLDAGTTTGGA